MTQAIERMLIESGHLITFQTANSESAMRQAVQATKPDLIICPTLMKAIPEDIYKAVKCLIVHPGIAGDRGPSAIDWAILNDATQWGVTIIEATAEMDAGDIWATAKFTLAIDDTKSSVYSSKIIPNAINLVSQCIDHYLNPAFMPTPLNYSNPKITGRQHKTIRQKDQERQIDWAKDSVDWVIKKIRAADGHPGCKAHLSVGGKQITRFLYGAHLAQHNENIDCNISAGEVLCRHKDAIAIAAKNRQIIWVTQLRKVKSKKTPHPFKLPAATELAEWIHHIPILEDSIFANKLIPYSAICYENKGDYGVLFFDFYNGAMSTEQCNDLTNAIKSCKADNIKILILAGSRSNWSNGIHLNTIENVQNPSQEAWKNIQAINRVIKSIIKLNNIISISAVQANAGAGGFYFSLATDLTFLRPNTIINPHYINMGLYGTELHTYTATKRLELSALNHIKEMAQPMSDTEAKHLGLVDDLHDLCEKYEIDCGKITSDNFLSKIENFVTGFLNGNRSNVDNFIAMKKRIRLRDENNKSIEKYEREELKHMRENIFNNNLAFHQKRTRFVKKLLPPSTPKSSKENKTEKIETEVF